MMQKKKGVVSTMVRPGIWEHYTGRRCHVIGVAIGREKHERSVVYIPQDGKIKGRLCVLPYTIFTQPVNDVEYKGPRYTLVEAKRFL